jgi:hypothetical protein
MLTLDLLYDAFSYPMLVRVKIWVNIRPGPCHTRNADGLKRVPTCKDPAKDPTIFVSSLAKWRAVS